MTRGNLCSTIGIVQQHPTLFRGSIRDNLRWGNENAEDKDLWLALEKGGFYQTLYNIQFQSV